MPIYAQLLVTAPASHAAARGRPGHVPGRVGNWPDPMRGLRRVGNWPDPMRPARTDGGN